MAVIARGLAKAAEILAGQFTLVATNVPYLGRGKQDDVIKEYCERVHPQAKADLATCFVERCLSFCGPACCTALVTPQSWTFLTSYRDLRETLLRNTSWTLALRLGPGAFETITGEVVKASLIAISKAKPSSDVAFVASDVSDELSPQCKAYALSSRQLNCVIQSNQLRNPDSRITTEEPDAGELLSTVADFGKGSTTGDRPRFIVCFWEFTSLKSQNSLWLDAPNSEARWCGREYVTTSRLDSEVLGEQLGCWLRGQEIWGRNGVAVAKMSGLQPFFYSGEVFDDNIGIIAPKGDHTLEAIWCFVESGDYLTAIRVLDEWVDAQAKEKGLTKILPATEKKMDQLHFGELVSEVVRDQAGQMELQRSLLEDEALRIRQELLAGLERVASATSSDPRQRLFAEDTARGLRLLELLGQYYDAILMNPPYGSFTKLENAADDKKFKAELKAMYPCGYQDIYAAFIERATQIIEPEGYIGALVSSTFKTNVGHAKFRTQILLKRNPLVSMLDLGFGILDGATVEAAALVLRGTAP